MNKKEKERIKKKEKEIISHSTYYLIDYKTWECKSISCNLTGKEFDQVKYVCKSRKLSVNDVMRVALLEYLKKNYPLEWDNARMYVKKIEMEKIEKPEENNLVEEYDRNE